MMHCTVITLQSRCWQSMVSCIINKVLLEQSHIYSFTYCLWLLLHYKGRPAELQQRHDGQQSLYMVFTIWSFSDPCFRMWTMSTAVSTKTRTFWHTGSTYVMAFICIMCDKEHLFLYVITGFSAFCSGVYF